MEGHIQLMRSPEIFNALCWYYYLLFWKIIGFSAIYLSKTNVKPRLLLFISMADTSGSVLQLNVKSRCRRVYLKTNAWNKEESMRVRECGDTGECTDLPPPPRAAVQFVHFKCIQRRCEEVAASFDRINLSVAQMQLRRLTFIGSPVQTRRNVRSTSQFMPLHAEWLYYLICHLPKGQVAAALRVEINLKPALMLVEINLKPALMLRVLSITHIKPENEKM